MTSSDLDRVPFESSTKIVCSFILDHTLGDAAGWNFMNPVPKRRRAEGRVPDQDFIARSVEVFRAALPKIHGMPVKDYNLRVSIEAKPHALIVHVIVDCPPYVRGLTARRALGACLAESLNHVSNFVYENQKLYSAGLALPALGGGLDGRHPLRPEWDEVLLQGGSYEDAYEPITDAVRREHALAVGAGAPLVFWNPPHDDDPPESLDGGILDRALGAYGLTAMGSVVPSEVEQCETTASALLKPPPGFTCPAGERHEAGTLARLEIKGGFSKYTCLAQSRGALFGFGSVCCVDHRRVPAELFELKHDKLLPMVVQDGIERAAPLPLSDVLSWTARGRCARHRHTPLGCRDRCGSGKTRRAKETAIEFRKKWPDGRVVVASSSIALVHATAEVYKAAFPGEEVLVYDTAVEGERKRLHSAPLVMVCTSSLPACIGDYGAVPTLLILDEPESTVGMLNALGGIKGVERVVGALQSCTASPFVCMLLDSHLNTGALALFKAAGFPKMFVVEGEGKPCKGVTCKIVAPVYQRIPGKYVGLPSYAFHLVAEDVRAGLNVFVPCSTKKEVQAGGNALRAEFGDKVEIHTLTSLDTDEHTRRVLAIFKGPGQRGGVQRDHPGVPLVILATSVISVGVDAGDGLFQSVVYAAASNGPSPSTVVQQISRPRVQPGQTPVKLRIVLMDTRFVLGRCSVWEEDPAKLDDFTSMEANEQAIVVRNKVDSIAQLRQREMMGGTVGAGPYFIHKADSNRVVRVRKKERELKGHDEVVEEQTHMARLAASARSAPNGANVGDILRGACSYSKAFTGNRDMDHLLVAPRLEMYNSSQCWLERLQLLAGWEFGCVESGLPLDCAHLLAEPNSALARMHEVYTDAVVSLSFDETVALAERLKNEWLDGAPEPLYKSHKERFRDIIARKRVEEHRPAEEPDEPDSDEEEQPEAVEEAPEFWTSQRRLQALTNLDLTVGRANTARLVDRVIGMKKCVEEHENYAAYVKTVKVKDQVPPECSVAGECPVKALGDLFADKQGTARLFRAYGAMRDGKESYVDDRVAELKKQHDNVGKPVAEWVNLCIAQEIARALGVTDLFAPHNKARTFQLAVTPELSHAVNQGREPKRRAALKNVQGMSKALGSQLNKVLMKKATKNGESELKMPQLVEWLLCVEDAHDGQWAKLREEAKKFWKEVYAGPGGGGEGR